jgi:hypothetical protein
MVITDYRIVAKFANKLIQILVKRILFYCSRQETKYLVKM